MQITSVELKNFKQFAELKFELQPKVNVFAGINGSGKTSVLQAIALGLGPVLYYFSKQQSFYASPSSYVRKAIMNSRDRKRLEAQYPLQITLHIQPEEQNLNNPLESDMVQKVEGSNDIPNQNSPEEKNFSTGILATDDTQHPTFQLLPKNIGRNTTFGSTLPVFAFYQAERYLSNTNLNDLSANLRMEERGSAYQNWNDAASQTETKKTLQWIVTKSIERMQSALSSGLLFDEVADDDLFVLCSALHNTFPEFKSIYYDWNAKSILIEWIRSPVESDGSHIDISSIDDLSDGQRNIILLYADIARRICLLNPHLGEEAAQKTDGIVLIDELDVHLHPDWQRKIICGLPKAFPSVQFIVTTHSPSVIGETPPSSLFLLSHGHLSKRDQSYGLNVSEVTAEILGASDQSEDIKAEDQTIRELVEEHKLEEARSKLYALENKLGGSTQTTRSLDAIISLAEAYGEDE